MNKFCYVAVVFIYLFFYPQVVIFESEEKLDYFLIVMIYLSSFYNNYFYIYKMAIKYNTVKINKRKQALLLLFHSYTYFNHFLILFLFKSIDDLLEVSSYSILRTILQN